MTVHRADPLAVARDHFEATGETAYLVGGRVRDELLGRRAVDTDVAVAGDAVAHGRSIAAAADGALVVLDAGRGVVRVAWPVPGQRRPITLDIARFTGADIVADLKARDFTVNAMAVPLAADAAAPGTVLDPTSGLADLAAGVLRMTSPEALDSDPVRLLRGPRIAALLGFRIESATAEAIRQRARRAAEPAAERIAAEVLRVLDGPRTDYGIAMLADLALLAALGLLARTGDDTSLVVATTLAEWLAGLGVQGYRLDGPSVGLPGDPGAMGPTPADSAHVPWPPGMAAPAPASVPPSLDRHRSGLVRHLEEPVSGCQRRSQLVALAGLVAWAGPAPAREVGAHLRLARREAEALVAVAKAVAKPPVAAARSGPEARRSIHRFFRAFQESGVDAALLLLARGGLAGHAKDVAVAEALLEAWFLEYDSVVSPPAIVSGDDLQAALGLEEGPVVGKALRAILEAQAAGEVSTVAQAMALARRVVQATES